MKQVLIIHGGSSFPTYDDYIDNLQKSDVKYIRLLYAASWKQWIGSQLSDHDVLLPTFPNGSNAQFEEWKIYFEKIIPFLGDDVQLVGHSLGAMFLAKYLQRHPLQKPVKRIVLIAGRYSEDLSDVGSFELNDTSGLTKSSHDIHLFHSEDDTVVPFGDIHKFARDIPSATLHTFSDRGHFNDSTFPELLDLLKQK